MLSCFGFPKPVWSNGALQVVGEPCRGYGTCRSRMCRTATDLIQGYKEIPWCYRKQLTTFVVPRLAGMQ